MSQSTFNYTVNNKGLTNEQREFYEENGFVLIKGLVGKDDLDTYAKRFADVCNGIVDNGSMLLMRDVVLMKQGNVKGERLIYKITDFLYDEVFFQYACNKKILDVVSSIIGDDITAVNSMVINKPPDAQITSKHPLHQDLYYFPFRPANKVCASWTAMEKVTLDNGCLFLIPGSHKWNKIYPHEYEQNVNNFAYRGVSGFDDYPKINLPMEPGDTVFFHPLILHGSWPNLTKGFRKAITVHYANSNCHFVNIRGTVQQPVVDEVEDFLKKKNISFPYEDMWKLKSKLVTGNPGKYQEMDSKL